MDERKSTVILIGQLVFSLLILGGSINGSFQASATDVGPPPWRPWNVTGVQKLVVVFTEFSDVVHSVDSQTIRNRLNEMATYFHNVSYGRISVDLTVYDHWKRLNKTQQYYGQDAASTHDVNGWQFIVDSMEAWDSQVNFSKYDCLLVIHAGEDQSSNTTRDDLLWRQNFCSFGRTSKRSVFFGNESYSFWGLAYDSEFEEWGLIAHEFGHSLSLPDLYIENESLTLDKVSLMARGDRNGNASNEGTWPASLDGFSKYMLGWLTPTQASLNLTQDVVEMQSASSSQETLIRVNLTESEYYLMEVREPSGYDQYAVDSTSLVVYRIDELQPSKTGIVTIGQGGVLPQNSTYSDMPNGVFARFISFDSIKHTAKIGLAAKLFFVNLDMPDAVEWPSNIVGRVKVVDSNNEPSQNVRLNISIGTDYSVLRTTDSQGEAEFEIGSWELDLGAHTVEISSPQMLTGELNKDVNLVFPWQTTTIFVLVISLAISLYYVRRYAKRKENYRLIV